MRNTQRITILRLILLIIFPCIFDSQYSPILIISFTIFTKLHIWFRLSNLFEADVLKFRERRKLLWTIIAFSWKFHTTCITTCNTRDIESDWFWQHDNSMNVQARLKTNSSKIFPHKFLAPKLAPKWVLGTLRAGVGTEWLTDWPVFSIPGHNGWLPEPGGGSPNLSRGTSRADLLGFPVLKIIVGFVASSEDPNLSQLGEWSQLAHQKHWICCTCTCTQPPWWGVYGYFLLGRVDIHGVFLHWTSSKKYGKPRLGESTLA